MFDDLKMKKKVFVHFLMEGGGGGGSRNPFLGKYLVIIQFKTFTLKNSADGCESVIFIATISDENILRLIDRLCPQVSLVHPVCELFIQYISLF